MPQTKGDGIKVNRNAYSTDLVVCVENFVQKLQNLQKGAKSLKDKSA